VFSEVTGATQRLDVCFVKRVAPGERLDAFVQDARWGEVAGLADRAFI